MNILLLYPEYPLTFWSFDYALKFISKKAAYPPLGLLTVAAMLPKDWEVRLTDLNIEKLKDQDLEWADYVMISAMLVQKESVHSILQRCSSLGKKVVAGGPLFNGTPEEYLDQVDHLILNEAEITLPLFLADLEKGNPQKVYRADSYPELSMTPIPRWDLIKVKKYATLMVQCSRGCPYDCEFCDITTLYGRKPRVKEAGQLIAELQAIYDMGWRGTVFIVDDNFIGNKLKIKKILPILIEWMENHQYPFRFTTEASINLADDDELIELMAEAAFDTVFIGLETPNEESLLECAKIQNRGRDMIAAIKKLQEAGIQVLGGYIVGFDSDDEGIFHRQIKFIQESGVVTAMVGLLNALPKTKLWKRLMAEDRLQLDTTGNNTDGTINFVPKMDESMLINGYRNIVRTIYSPRYYYRRVCNFLQHYQPRRSWEVQRDDIKAFFKSIFYLGIVGNGASQWYYWKMLGKSILFHRSLFPDAVKLMVFGYHFRKVAKKL
ncbi:MAG: B12-binding domain-containing radical SAM protein [Deltaproteobacteria bacterium]|nr:B12-binding domain-containing radical SAM protein [Deltaproteobacteria bacterium]